MKKEFGKKLLKFIIVLLIATLFFGGIFLILKCTGLLSKISDLESLRSVIKEGGIFSALIFFVLQFLQVTILPLPSFLTTLAGALVFGPYVASVISLFAIFFGSLFAFFLGRKYGKKLVVWIVGKDEAEKWEGLLSKGKYAFALMMIFPLFPDDILCLVAGITKMSYKFFVLTILITRPISIICTCFFGSGYLIPFSGAGIPIWCVIILFMTVAFVLSIKYQDKIAEKIEILNKKIQEKSQRKKKNVK